MSEEYVIETLPPVLSQTKDMQLYRNTNNNSVHKQSELHKTTVNTKPNSH